MYFLSLAVWISDEEAGWCLVFGQVVAVSWTETGTGQQGPRPSSLNGSDTSA
jgi:hypothetical protein